MKQNKYYVSAKQDNLDLGMVIEAENPYMAAVKMASLLWENFSLDDVTVTDVDMMEAKNDK
ncbi:hypothetical protein [Streptococcus agalactiae]|uniref:hypothetical protein n=1 Tax=Streptococcus agalactiae TaxID=1311 RepID=UPI00085CA20F|nr:hypothetical protein [Streptococcus agalactiae]